MKYRELGGAQTGELSAAVATRIAVARARQHTRLGEGRCNAEMHARELHTCARPDPAGAALVERAMAKLGLSARAYTRVLKVARTIADLAGAEQITMTVKARSRSRKRCSLKRSLLHLG